MKNSPTNHTKITIEKKNKMLFINVLRNVSYKYLPFVFLLIFLLENSNVAAQKPEGFSTFHSIGLYWKPSDAAVDNECTVKFRREGTSAWKQGFSLWFDPNIHPGLENHSHEYRGSLVDLVPGTNYEVELELLKTGSKETLSVKTLDEAFPIKSVVFLDKGEFSEPLEIKSGGSKKEGYILYTVKEGNRTIDVRKLKEYCVKVDAPYVIINGLTFKGAIKHGIIIGDVDHVVIEDCDISGWGSIVTSGLYTGFGKNVQSAIYSESAVASHIIIQRNRLHHPSTDTNSWSEPVASTHPQGAQGITMLKTPGFNIIRYNEIYSDMSHMFNDGMGAFLNFSFEGFPNRDSDVYGNRVSHCWDDGIEAEGSGMNVRIWGNYTDTTFVAFGLASQSLGPFYLYRNVSNYSNSAPYPLPKYNRGGLFCKIGGPPDKPQYAKGKLILLHNTILQPPTPWKTGAPTAGVESGIKYTSDAKLQEYIYSRNNILHVRKDNASISDHNLNETNSFDFDLYSGKITAANGNEKNGVTEIPIYDINNRTNEFFLAPTSSGRDGGVIIQNFNSNYNGNGPDIGAFENGLPALKFGINSDWNEWVNVVNSIVTKKVGNLLNRNAAGTENLFMTHPTLDGEVQIKVDATKAIGKLDPFWASQIIHPTEFLLTEWGRNLVRLMKETGAAQQYIRIYNQPENAIRIDADGKITYDWSRFDQMADLILSTGNKLEIAFFGMPTELALYPESARKRPYGELVCTSPPKDYKQWEELCTDFAKHIVSKYGLNEVKKWTLRCWNEPDGGFWYKSDLNEYMKLYDYFAKGVKEVNSDIKIGGPALTSTGTWNKPENFRFFLDHIVNGTNFATGKTGAPIDFIAIHTYGGSSGGPGPGRKSPDVDYMIDQQIRLADIRDEYPSLKNVPIHVEEWGETSGGTTGVDSKRSADIRNSQYGAAFLATWVGRHIQMRQENDRKIEKFTFCSSGYEKIPERDFMGYRTFDTKSGFYKPILNAYKLLSKLASDMVPVVTEESGRDVTAFASRDKKRITIVVANYQSGQIENEGTTYQVSLNINTQWKPGTKINVKHWRIDEDHSNAYTIFKKLGSPALPNPLEIDAIKSRMDLELLENPATKQVGDMKNMEFQLPCNAVSLIEITKD